MLLETRRLLIRDLRRSDGAYFAQMAGDGSLLDIGFDPNAGDWMGNWIEEALALSSADDPRREYLAYTVALKDNGVVIGSVGCSWYEDLCEVGITYFIGAQFRGAGYAAEAVSAYVPYFFRHYEEDRLIATVREENPASWKVLEKAGFVLKEKRMYQDINDHKPQLYRFYRINKGEYDGEETI